MSTIKRTPTENHADALMNFRHYLRGARRDAAKARGHATGVVREMDTILRDLPEETDIMALDEAALLRAVGKRLEALDASSSEGDDAAKSLASPLSCLLGAIDEATLMHRYLTAGDFSDED